MLVPSFLTLLVLHGPSSTIHSINVGANFLAFINALPDFVLTRIGIYAATGQFEKVDGC